MVAEVKKILEHKRNPKQSVSISISNKFRLIYPQSVCFPSCMWRTSKLEKWNSYVWLTLTQTDTHTPTHSHPYTYTHPYIHNWMYETVRWNDDGIYIKILELFDVLNCNRHTHTHTYNWKIIHWVLQLVHPWSCQYSYLRLCWPSLQCLIGSFKVLRRLKTSLISFPQ